IVARHGTGRDECGGGGGRVSADRWAGAHAWFRSRSVGAQAFAACAVWLAGSWTWRVVRSGARLGCLLRDVFGADRVSSSLEHRHRSAHRTFAGGERAGFDLLDLE